jgi:hypothetical protein
MVLRTSLPRKNPPRFLSLKPIPLSEGMIRIIFAGKGEKYGPG